MPRMARLVVPGFAHHITQRGGRRQRTFFEEADYAAYIRGLRDRLAEVDISVWAYCLMPNHVHFVVVPRTEDALSKLFGHVHAQYARTINKAHDWQGHLWQERFFSTVMDEIHTLAAMRYVEWNPVRAGLCNQPVEWPWSSARAHLRLANDPLLDLKATDRVVDDYGPRPEPGGQQVAAYSSKCSRKSREKTFGRIRAVDRENMVTVPLETWSLSLLRGEPAFDMGAQCRERDRAVFEHAVVELTNIEVVAERLLRLAAQGQDLEAT